MSFAILSLLEPIAKWLEQAWWAKLQRLGLVVLTCVLILLAVHVVARAVRRAVDDGDENTTSEAERRAETLSAVLNNAARVLVLVFLLLMVLQEFGINIAPLIAGAGIAGVALGFGAQSLVKDVISGFFLLMEDQFGVGDLISIDEKHVGTVERMTLRITQLRDVEGRAHYVPNGSINRVIVLSKEFSKALVDVEVGYDADLDQIFALLETIGVELRKDRPELILEPTDVRGVESFGKDGCTIRTLTKSAPGKQFDVARLLRKRIIERFRAEGIASPIPQRIVHTKTEGDAAATAAPSTD
ncbi:MAG: mechanosensitive ion channel family protein [Holophagaceae bacterium]|nr:mechanosensitive ion channel family protein [Holophagaceae bacterium]